jgi:hypothetical protein
MTKLLRCLVPALGLALWGAAVAPAEDHVTMEELLGGLDNPCGVAVQPETGHVFVSVTGEPGKIIRFNPADKKVEDAIVGFAKDVYGKGPIYDIGPLGLAFQDKNTLIVGGGGNKDEEELVFVYTVPEPGKQIKADEAKQKLGPLGKTDQVQAEGNYYGVAVTKDAVYVSCNGDDTKGWVARALFKNNQFEKLERFIATKEAVQVDAPVAMAISPRGRIVVSQMGEVNVEKDSLLTFYHAPTGKLLMKLKTNLHDISALAYSPPGKALGWEFKDKDGKPEKSDVQLLYALDFAWPKPEEGGLFRLDDDGKKNDDPEKGIKVVKLCALDKPTAMAFDKDGAAYVTVFGTAKEGDAAKPGKLLKITHKSSVE